MIMSSRHKQPFTHFLSLPVNSNNLQQTFSKFKKEVFTPIEKYVIISNFCEITGASLRLRNNNHYCQCSHNYQ